MFTNVRLNALFEKSREYAKTLDTLEMKISSFGVGIISCIGGGAGIIAGGLSSPLFIGCAISSAFFFSLPHGISLLASHQEGGDRWSERLKEINPPELKDWSDAQNYFGLTENEAMVPWRVEKAYKEATEKLLANISEVSPFFHPPLKNHLAASEKAHALLRERIIQKTGTYDPTPPPSKPSLSHID